MDVKHRRDAAREKNRRENSFDVYSNIPLTLNKQCDRIWIITATGAVVIMRIFSIRYGSNCWLVSCVSRYKRLARQIDLFDGRSVDLKRWIMSVHMLRKTDHRECATFKHVIESGSWIESQISQSLHDPSERLWNFEAVSSKMPPLIKSSLIDTNHRHYSIIWFHPFVIALKPSTWGNAIIFSIFPPF